MNRAVVRVFFSNGLYKTASIDETVTTEELCKMIARKLAIENNKNRWASKEEAYLFAKKAEKEGKLGMSYLACCDYLGWDVSLRREIMAKHKRKAHTHE